MADSGHKVAFSILSGHRDKEATSGSMDSGRIGKEGRKEVRKAGGKCVKSGLGFPVSPSNHDDLSSSFPYSCPV